nr:hypothetical protein CFP56_20544 [Quercus suber]
MISGPEDVPAGTRRTLTWTVSLKSMLRDSIGDNRRTMGHVAVMVRVQSIKVAELGRSEWRSVELVVRASAVYGSRGEERPIEPAPPVLRARLLASACGCPGMNHAQHRLVQDASRDCAMTSPYLTLEHGGGAAGRGCKFTGRAGACRADFSRSPKGVLRRILSDRPGGTPSSLFTFTIPTTHKPMSFVPFTIMRRRYGRCNVGMTSDSTVLARKNGGVSHPSIVEHKPSQTSITASEDYYYSISNSSSLSVAAPTEHPGTYRHYTPSTTLLPGNESTNTIHRYVTPPSRFRTPLQSRDYLPLHDQEQHASGALDGEDMRRTPMRGPGRRRQSSSGSYTDRRGSNSYEGAGLGGITVPESSRPREGAIRRKPVPSIVMEGSSRPSTQGAARSSVAQDIERFGGQITPGRDDDTPYIRFALDQLTRDEEVRQERGLPERATASTRLIAPEEPRHDRLVAAGAWPHSQSQLRQDERFDDPPPRNPARQVSGGTPPVDTDVVRDAPPEERLLPLPLINTKQQAAPQQQGQAFHQSLFEHQPQNQRSGRFISIPSSAHKTPLEFLPGTLRPLSLSMFLLLLLAYTACLIICAAWSLADRGLATYTAFGDAKYFVFEYLPTLLGAWLLLWTIQIEIAVYRISPFIALASSNARTRQRGAMLPLTPKGFLLPYLGHFRAGQPLIAIFMLVAWLQLWTLPLLASSFNVYFIGPQGTGQWYWIATQGPIWVVIILYLFLFLAVAALMLWLRKRETGLLWDPRSLADIIVILARSNALNGDDQEQGKLGYWTTDGRREVFHTFGVEGRPARTYSLGEDGRLRETKVDQYAAENDVEKSVSGAGDGERTRESRENMLPRHSTAETGIEAEHATRHIGSALPWFLRPSLAALWIIIAVVLVLAFLIASYLPSTSLTTGFSPLVPAPVTETGFSSTNFLYSFVPALLGTLCLAFWLDVDHAYRRLTPMAALVKRNGETPEKSLLASYSADAPLVVTAAALANGHVRLALITFVTLLATTLPVLGGGVFWAQFFVSSQSIRISTHLPAYYALSVFAVLFALAWFLAFPPALVRHLPAASAPRSFAAVLDLIHQSRLVDDISFHSPASRTDLVTRLLSGGGVLQHDYTRTTERAPGGAHASKVSLADSIRGLAKARRAVETGHGHGGAAAFAGENRYYLGRLEGRDGRAHEGLDRVRE